LWLLHTSRRIQQGSNSRKMRVMPSEDNNPASETRHDTPRNRAVPMIRDVDQ
jgi:hypothetical protein